MNHFTDLLLPAIVGLTVMALLDRRILHSRAENEKFRSVTVVSTESYGQELASAVATRLERGDVLAYGHRDYCGMGLRFADGEFIYGEVHDGDLPTTQEIKNWSWTPENMERLSFQTKTKFIEWLSEQSDKSLNAPKQDIPQRAGNQRITLNRLKSFADGLPVPYVATNV